QCNDDGESDEDPERVGQLVTRSVDGFEELHHSPGQAVLPALFWWCLNRHDSPSQIVGLPLLTTPGESHVGVRTRGGGRTVEHVPAVVGDEPGSCGGNDDDAAHSFSCGDSVEHL